jgi:GNAT superfamily N-acetyltransferase
LTSLHQAPEGALRVPVPISQYFPKVPTPPGLSEVCARPIGPADLGFLQALYAQTRAEEVAAAGWSEDAQAAFLAQQFNFQHRYYQEHHADAHFLLLLRGGCPIGRLYWRDRGVDAVLIDVSLLAQARGQGIGSALLSLLMAHADARGQAVGLHVEPANPARRLYARCGFTVVADTGVYLQMHRPPVAEAMKESIA